MSITTALYEGDSIIHRAPRGRPAVKTPAAGAHRATRPATALERVGLPTAELKGWTSTWTFTMGAVWNALRSAALWLDEKSRQAHYRRIESYLAQSTDHADLERRLRDLERGNRLNWIDCGSR